MALSHADGLLACPRCGSPLSVEAGVVRCPDGHAYDVARQGYLNLLGGPQPTNADSAAMIEARGRVLSDVYGDVVALVADAVAATRADVVVDAGGGRASTRPRRARPPATRSGSPRTCVAAARRASEPTTGWRRSSPTRGEGCRCSGVAQVVLRLRRGTRPSSPACSSLRGTWSS